MYDISVNIFIHYLRQLSGLLEKAQHSLKGNTDKEVLLLNSRLVPDMFPLIQQIKTAIGFSLRACWPLANIEIPKEKETENTLAELQEKITRTIDHLKSIPEASFYGSELRLIETTTGFKKHSLSGKDFLSLYALPNFFFHLSMVYAILRPEGIPIGKPDFDGFHQYPEGFSF